MRLHHVQVACPAGGEDDARRFYADGLGLVEVAKPAALAGRGGCWFRAYGDGGDVAAEIHVGVEDPFRPAAKAHPALVVDDVATLDRLAGRACARRATGSTPVIGRASAVTCGSTPSTRTATGSRCWRRSGDRRRRRPSADRVAELDPLWQETADALRR